jgi:hypothetical protein
LRIVSGGVIAETGREELGFEALAAVVMNIYIF